MNFSRKLVTAYSCIVVIPLFIIVIIAMGTIRKSRVKELVTSSEGLIFDNYVTVMKNISTCNSFEQIINGNGKLTLLFSIPERSTESELIETLLEETTNLERTLETAPEIYGLRIFSNSPYIPERWPIFMNTSRANLEILSRWEYNYTADYLGNVESLKYESVCTTRKLVKNQKQIGYIQIAMKTSDFFPFLYKSNEYNNDYVFRELLNPLTNQMELIPVTNKIVERTQSPLPQEMLGNLRRAIYFHEKSDFAQSGKLVLRNKDDVRYSSWIRVPDMNIILLHTCSSISIQKELFFIQSGIILALLATVALLYFLIRYMTGRLMARVYGIIDGMKQIQEGNLNANVVVTGNDEVTQAQSSFNRMTEQLRSQIEEIKNEQQLIADTEMKAMQNQINAHFLYNALETIKMQAVIAGEDDIEESIETLGKLMRYCLRWKVHVVELEEEISYIRSYIYLLNIRNDYVISLETEIQDEYKNMKVPKMSLQPIVENAFFYAIEPRGEDATIKVFTQDSDEYDKFYLCVQDFGCGIAAEKLAEMNAYLADDTYERESKGSIGLKNIQQRLSMFCGKSYRLKIESEEGKGTLVKIPLPKNFSFSSGSAVGVDADTAGVDTGTAGGDTPGALAEGAAGTGVESILANTGTDIAAGAGSDATEAGAGTPTPEPITDSDTGGKK